MSEANPNAEPPMSNAMTVYASTAPSGCSMPGQPVDMPGTAIPRRSNADPQARIRTRSEPRPGPPTCQGLLARAAGSWQLGEDGYVKVDDSMQDPQCVLQVMKRHYARYTPEVVSKITGTPQDKFLKV